MIVYEKLYLGTFMSNGIENKFRSEELHKVALSSFVQGSYELDRTILNLSVGSLGFILTFATTFKYSNCILSFFIIITFLISLFGFGFTVYKLLDIFKLNKEYFEKIISDENEQDILELENRMQKIDFLTSRVFKISILFSSIFILLIVIQKNL